MTHTSRSTLTSLCLLTSLFIFSGSQSTIRAQATAVAQVSGTVSDATGAAIVNAQVTMTETSKNVVRAVATDTSGRYTLPNLPVGPYRLEVKSQGFRDYIQGGIQLVVNNNIEINVPM
jgi:DNA/RNA endonuclease YhcR with UshA esterase domain